MANSTTGTLGTNPRIPSPKTPGPIGANSDVADPSTPFWFRGDTPGPLGVNDYADPDVKMCRLRTSIGISGHVPAVPDVEAGNVKKFALERLKPESSSTSSPDRRVPNGVPSVAGSTKPSENLADSPKWTGEDEDKVRQIVADALTRKKGDVALAFAYTRDLRQRKENYYDTNLAIASDYLRARWETLKWGPGVARAKLESYMQFKKLGITAREGPGPVSPYSAQEHKWMRAGVIDQAAQPDKDVGVYWRHLDEFVRFIGERMHD